MKIKNLIDQYEWTIGSTYRRLILAVVLGLPSLYTPSFFCIIAAVLYLLAAERCRNTTYSIESLKISKKEQLLFSQNKKLYSHASGIKRMGYWTLLPFIMTMTFKITIYERLLLFCFFLGYWLLKYHRYIENRHFTAREDFFKSKEKKDD